MPVFPVAFVRGDGCRLWDAEGKSYLDFFASLAVMNLGQCHPAVVKAVQEQVSTLTHISNLHYIIPQARLAELLCTHSFADKVFFCNSGAEANEASIKLARKYGVDKREGRYEILSTLGSFHGRTMATIAATGQEKVRQGFGPVLEGFRYVPFGDLAAMEAALSDKNRRDSGRADSGRRRGGRAARRLPQRIARVVRPQRAAAHFRRSAKSAWGRTGKLFAHEHEGVTPDIMPLAKALGGGVPIGAMLTTAEVAESLSLGTHGSTFGGNAIACAAGIAVVETLLNEGVLDNCAEMGAYFLSRLQALKEKFSFITDVRGKGLILGAELDREGGKIADTCLTEGVMINCAAGKVLRFLPPLDHHQG